MILPEPYILNHQYYTQESLITFAREKITADHTPGWEQDLFRFIVDLFNDQVALTQQTSGTTGEPKTIPLERDAMIVSARRTLEYFGLQQGNSALLCLPVQYIAGKMMVVRALLGGLNLVTIEPSGNPLKSWMPSAKTDSENRHRPSDKKQSGNNRDESQEEATEDINELENPRADADMTGMGIDFAAMVPLQLYELLQLPGTFPEIRTLIIGGGEIGPALRKKIIRLEGARIYETFAMSETYSHFAVRRINGQEAESEFRVMPGVTIGTDDRGCLTVDAGEITSGKVITNDMVRIIDDGSFQWLGRLDNVIKTGGIKVIPETIEAVVKELTGREAVVIPRPDRRLGQKLVLVLEAGKTTKEDAADPDDVTARAHYDFRRTEEPQLYPGDSGSTDVPVDDKDNNLHVNHSPGQVEQLDPDQLITLLETRLATHEIPKEIMYLPAFPRNRSMKIDRRMTMQMLGIR